MPHAETLAMLRLQHVPRIGAITAKKLIAHCGSAIAVFAERKRTLLKIDGIGQQTIEGLYDFEHLEAAESEYALVEKKGWQCSHFMEALYPELLAHCVDGPLVLFQKGKLDLQGKKLLSIVGTRTITAYGKAFCEELIAELAPLEPVIVSGFAYGVDIYAQKLAVKHGLQTVACMAHGLDRTYPPAHASLAPQLEQYGGFVTEFWSGTTPDRENFLKRNRIIAGLSQATLVVESAEKGGSLVTAELANGYNREVFAVPGRAGDRYSTGCNDLIKKQRAQMVTSAAEIVYHLNWDWEEKEPTVVQPQLFLELDEGEQLVHRFLTQHGKQLLDHIALECQLPISKASTALFGLEMKGLVRPLPGKLFEAL